MKTETRNETAKQLLQAAGVPETRGIHGPTCPTCGRDNSEYGNVCTSDDCDGVIAASASAKHTPGPWECGEIYGKPAKSVVKERNGAQTHIALVGNVNVTDSKIEANARLIAAAPELLEALQQVVVWNMTATTERDWTSYRLAVMETVKRTIARATGGEI